MATIDQVVTAQGGDDPPPLEQDPLVMQIIVRRDLLDQDGWGVGPLMTQAAHAATAVLHETRDRRETIDYLADLKNMRKVVLQTPDATSLLKLSTLLATPPSPIPHHLWTEQPEDVPTCIALAPNRREKPVRRALDKSSCRLWR
ncbi:peptidyl-tRNA hydrolase II [Leucogyrophana mollusca]|uniref:Peptidyl-tRNA hydrolase II n=1 Tax=Leucogyrophana mollusca TaxID=85980 RepID=A0ACB8BRX3_9AGAM|nr:peptidyl-tRNA hydrolase II [Leucogyrophana mollusca]